MEGTFRTLVDTFSCYNVFKGMSRLQQNSLIIANFQSHLFSPVGILKEFLEQTAAAIGTAKFQKI